MGPYRVPRPTRPRLVTRFPIRQLNRGGSVRHARAQDRSRNYKTRGWRLRGACPRVVGIRRLHTRTRSSVPRLGTQTLLASTGSSAERPSRRSATPPQPGGTASATPRCSMEPPASTRRRPQRTPCTSRLAVQLRWDCVQPASRERVQRGQRLSRDGNSPRRLWRSTYGQQVHVFHARRTDLWIRLHHVKLRSSYVEQREPLLVVWTLLSKGD